MRKGLTIDWALVEKLIQVPCGAMDISFVLGISERTLRLAISQRADMAQAFSEISKSLRRGPRRTRERGRRIAEVVEAHRAAQ